MVTVKPEIWTEKYRPKTLTEVTSHSEITSTLRKTSNLPHLLFYGPAGTGKTSTALALCRDLFKNEKRVLELNASDERGISVIREKIKAFAKLTVAQKEGMPQFKVVILDECDSLTSEAQAALRRTMEVFSRHTRFILICNYISRIIEPLSSRCAKFRFKPLPREVCVGKLKQICDCEKLSIETAILEKICDGCDGDLRRCITLLQTLKGNYDLIDDCLGVIPENVVVDVYLEQGNIDHVLMNGYSPFQLVLQVFDYIQMEPTMSNKEKSLIAAKLAVVEKCLIDGASSRLQLLDLFYFCKSIMASA